ncbi:cAMP-activated global transcriptional regulator CRP [Rhodocyclaceae bacterium]|nr:cAMP-activated global transcriptional regulator CRP [Rhodocyclaceae bacterium]
MNSVSIQDLGTIPFFAGLPDRLLGAVAKASVEKPYEKEKVVFLKGDLPKALFAVVSGTVRLACQSPKGEEKVIDLLGAGRVFGESALLLDSPYPCMAAATTPARLLQIDGRALLDLIDTSPPLMLRLAKNLSQGVVNAVRTIEDYRTLKPHGRLARFLLDGRDDAEEAHAPITLPATKHVFASLLGITPESLSRVIRDLAEAGVIENRGRNVSILDGRRLAALAC